MSRILFLSWWWPYPADNGSKIRIYNLLKHLSQSHQVSLLSFAEIGEATPERLAHLRSFLADVEVIPKPAYQPTTLKATLGYLSPWPRSLVDVYSPQMAERVQAIAQGGIDAVIASQLQTMRYLELLPDTRAILEEAEVTMFHDAVDGAESMKSRARAQLTLTKLENALKRLLRRGVAFTVASEAERDYLRRIAPPDARIEVVPNGVDTHTNRPDSAIQPKLYSLIYSGAVTYSANYDAVSYFIRDVLPLVRARAPQTVFTVTGDTGKVDVSDLAAKPGVTFSGYLPSVAPAVQSSWAMVTPLRFGGGTRLKILEAMALGTTVISTAKGVEGLNVRSGTELLIADTPAEIADAVCDLFASPERRAQLAAAGRALVEREYDWGIITGRLADLVSTLTQDKTPVGRG
jgi:glycosyltransferase involved in cell wall biosynthesis